MSLLDDAKAAARRLLVGQAVGNVARVALLFLLLAELERKR